MEKTDPVARLTEREKEVLRLWLQHKTAKEIALDIGISHHAVEKRLKMARTKLDVATSLDAARVLAQAEGYDQTVAQESDLDPSGPNGNRWFIKPLLIGAAAMILPVTLAIVLLSQQSVAELELKPGDLPLVAPMTFEQLDEDKSGYLEGNEVPPLIHASGNAAYVPDGNGNAELSSDEFIIVTEPMRVSFYRQADTNGDRRVSPEEYNSWAKPQLDRMSPDS